MIRIVDIAAGASMVLMIAYTGAVGPTRAANTFMSLAHNGRPAAGSAVRPPRAKADAASEGLVQSCLTGGSSPPFYLCPNGRNELRLSRSPVREPTSFRAVKPMSILPED
jgi:hypothetical protein